MVAIAVVLILAAVILTGGAVFGGSESSSFDIFGGSISASGTQIFLLGLATGLILVVGLKTLQIGAKRARVRGRELRELRAMQREFDRKSVDEKQEADTEERSRDERRSPFDIDSSFGSPTRRDTELR